MRELYERLDAEGIAEEARVIRPVAAEGFADVVRHTPRVQDAASAAGRKVLRYA